MGHQHSKQDFEKRSRTHDGEVSEWFKELVLKTSDSARGRGFESHPLRHKTDLTDVIFNLEKYSRG